MAASFQQNMKLLSPPDRDPHSGFTWVQAHDFEAYQEMLRETAPQGTSSERFEVISKFLTTTEEYLNKLSSKVASVKMTQEASEAAALAVTKGRAQVHLLILAVTLLSSLQILLCLDMPFLKVRLLCPNRSDQ